MFDRFFSSVLLIIAAVVDIYLCICCVTSRGRNFKRIHIIMGWSAIINIVELFIILSHSYNVVSISYSVFFVAWDMVLYFFLQFCLEYTGFEKKYNINPLWLAIPIGIDSVTLLSNCMVHWVFAVDDKIINGQKYIKVVLSKGLYFHFWLLYFMLVSCAVILILKIRASAKIYFGKYGPMLIGINCIMVLNAAFALFEWSTDKSIFIFSIGAIWMYHTALIYTPTELLHSAMMNLADDLSDALVITDDMENCIYVNKLAISLLGVTKGDLDGNDYMHVWCGEKSIADTPDFNKYVDVADIKNPDRMCHLKLLYRRMYDSRGRYEGSFFQIRDLTNELNHIEQDKYNATHDSLTGLYNREWFIKRCESRLKKEPDEKFLLICLDVAGFKFINDLFGPETGDQVLKSIGRIMDEKCGPDDIYCRMQSDHFLILMRKADFSEEKFNACAIESQNMLKQVNYPIKIYTGVYEITDSSIPVSIMCDRAHMAIEAVSGKDVTVAYYSDDIRSLKLKNQDIVSGLDEAIRKNEIKIFIQAQTDRDGISHGGEALVRWIHEDGSMVYPNDFIPVLEESGAIIRLDMRVWELACMKLKEWKERGIKDRYISVNISPKDFYYLDLYKHFTGLVSKYGIDVGTLRLEITETAIMMNSGGQIEVINKLREAGFVLEIDDFGSGYSSLNLLKDFQADVLKIDMLFLSKTENQERSHKIINVIVDMAHGLDMDIVVEGVETKEQLDTLYDMGCRTFQGYYFSKPVPVSEYEEKFM